MPRKKAHDWQALKQDFFALRAGGATTSILEFCRSKGIEAKTTVQRNTRGWLDELARFQEHINKRDMEEQGLNQLAERKLVRSVRDGMLEAYREMEQLYLERVRHAKKQKVENRDWHPTAADLARVGKALGELTVIGAGLPKVHEVKVDDTEALLTEQEKQRRIRAAETLSAWGRRKGLLSDPPGPDDKVH